MQEEEDFGRICYNMFMKIEFEKETDGRWIAEIPRLPGVMAYGKTKQEAQRKVYAQLPYERLLTR